MVFRLWTEAQRRGSRTGTCSYEQGGLTMLHIRFKYKDKLTESGQWSEQECIAESVKECIKFYGLDQSDVEYKIISIEEVT